MMTDKELFKTVDYLHIYKWLPLHAYCEAPHGHRHIALWSASVHTAKFAK